MHHTLSRNGPVATNGHMVQNLPRWIASYTLGHPKQRKFMFDLMKSLCFGCSVHNLLFSMADSVLCDR